MMRIINSRLYQGLIPVTNYMILGLLAMTGVATVFLAYPIIAACLAVAIQIYHQGNETLTRRFFVEFKRHLLIKVVIGLFVSGFALLFYYVFTHLFGELILPIRVSLIVSLVLFFALIYFMLFEGYAQRKNFHFSKFFRNAVLDLVVELPYTILFALLTGLIIFLASLMPLSTYFSLTFLNVILAALYHKRLKNKLSRF